MSKIAKLNTANIVAAVIEWRTETLARLNNSTSLDETKAIREEANAFQAALKYATKGRLDAVALQNNAGMVRVKAEARIGEMTLALREAKGTAQGRRSELPNHGEEVPDVPTTEELGLKDEERRRFEELAKADRSGKLDEYIQRCEQEQEPISTRGAIRAAKGVHVTHNSGENEWYTPPDYIEAARVVLGEIDLDPASSAVANKVVKAKRYYDVQSNGLDSRKRWKGRVWMNPPYAQPLIGEFCERIVTEYGAGNIEAAIVLVNNGTETKWGQRLLLVASAVCFPSGRIRFIDTAGNPGGAPLQGQMVVYLGKKVAAFRRAFADKGVVCER